MANRPEAELQKDIVRLLDYSKILCYATSNELLHFAPMGVREKYVKQGVKAGAPDLTVIANDNIVFVELKNGKKGRQSPAQKKMEYEITRRGHQYAIWRSLDDCIAWIEGRKK